MFYAGTLDQRFRFGDIIEGFATATPIINNPPIDASRLSFQIDIAKSGFYVVLSPCCSINERIVVLCPLIELRAAFLNNPYLQEDLTRINKPMMPEQSVPPDCWQRLPDSEKQKRLSVGLQYAFVELFVYAEHPILPSYFLSLRDGSREECKQHMIDFRQSFTVRCERITNNSTPFENVKCLQLSTDIRSELRAKMAAYYSRIPEEDKALED
jgi:hypothetical protein